MVDVDVDVESQACELKNVYLFLLPFRPIAPNLILSSISIPLKRHSFNLVIHFELRNNSTLLWNRRPWLPLQTLLPLQLLQATLLGRVSSTSRMGTEQIVIPVPSHLTYFLFIHLSLSQSQTRLQRLRRKVESG